MLKIKHFCIEIFPLITSETSLGILLTISHNQSYFQTNTLALQFVIILKVSSYKLINSTYHDQFPIAANVVIGTTVFSDIGASYVDFFVGRSTRENNGEFKKKGIHCLTMLDCKTEFFISIKS